MEKHTEREMRVTLAWLELQWNRPARSDWYLMQIASLLVQGSSRGRVQRFKMRFDTDDTRISMSPEAALAASKARWMGRRPPEAGR